MAWLNRPIYTLLLRLALPLLLLRLFWRGRKEPAYTQRIGQRLGLYGDLKPVQGAVWLHAVSLGETRAAAILLRELRAQVPGMRLLLTHGTATGRAEGQRLLRPGDQQAWLPWDTPGAVHRFLATHRPVAGVVMETEVWPNLLFEAERAGVPMVLAKQFTGNGTTTVRAAEGGSERLIEGELVVRVPVLGKQMEAKLVESVEKSYAQAAELALTMLRERAAERAGG